MFRTALDWEEEIFDVGSSSEEVDLSQGWGGPMIMGPNWLRDNLVLEHGIQNRLPCCIGLLVCFFS